MVIMSGSIRTHGTKKVVCWWIRPFVSANICDYIVVACPPSKEEIVFHVGISLSYNQPLWLFTVNCIKIKLLNNQVVWASVARCFFQERTRGITGSILRGTTFDQCACRYARAGLVAHLWWIGNRCESKKIKLLNFLL
jgi:hypothetical protein